MLHARWLWLAAVTLVLAGAILLVGRPLADGIYLDQAAGRGQNTMRLAVSALEGQMRRFESLPPLIADDDDIQDLMREPENTVLRRSADVALKGMNRLLGSNDIYVMDPGGTTIAASNFDAPVSFLGENFSYRPYFQDAIAGKAGRFFALGTTSFVRGYYFSAPIWIESTVAGVVVFKVDLDTIEASWRGGDYEIIVTDPEGIIFMSGEPDWLYASLKPLTPDRLARTELNRRYANAELRELPILSDSRDGRLRLMSVGAGGAAQEFLVLSEPMPDAGWTVNVLLDTASARAQAFTMMVGAFLLLGLAVLVIAFILLRRAQLSERIAIQTRAQAELERRVEERTADLGSVNRLLESEVAERRATEIKLRQTQSDLVQAGKLAALGQMAAALSHEFNQPLAAVKTYAENAAILIDRERIAEARDTVGRIVGLADRMASIGRHLRNFARKPNQKLGPVPIGEVIADTLEIVGPRLKSAGAVVEIDSSDPLLAATGGSVRLQQVLVNIISNAADAVEGQADRRIGIGAKQADGRVVITVRDHGPGVPPAIAERIFDPFFSTKGVGKGLGLGLSISYNIIKDFGGTLDVSTHPDGGAVFSIGLEAARLPVRQAAE